MGIRFLTMRLAPLALGLLFAPASQPGLSSTNAATAQVLTRYDPALPGPFAVGVTRRSFTRNSSTTGEPRVLNTVIWYPAVLGSEGLTAGVPILDGLEADPGFPSLGALDADPDRGGAPYPVVIFSHGFRGTPVDSAFLLTHLASHGFVVMAPFHPGSVLPPNCPTWSWPSPCTDRGWNPDSLTNRPADLGFELDAVSGLSEADDPILAGLPDRGRAGLAGFSFGGWTALRELADAPRFRGAVVMAPGQPGLEPRQSVAQTRAPIMLFAGRMDAVVPLSRSDPRTVPPRSGAPPIASLEDLHPELLAVPDRWLVVLPHGGHFSFTGRCEPRERAGDRCPETLPQDQAYARVRRWATAFLLYHVAGDQRYAALLNPELVAGDPEVEITRAPGP